jgi:hypothetical protein
VPGDNSIATTIEQSAATASPGSAYRANLFIANLATGVTDPVPAGTTFYLTVQRPMGTTVGEVSYTTLGSSSPLAVLGGLQAALAAHPVLPGAGYSMGIDSVGGVTAGQLYGPANTGGVYLQTSGTGGFGLNVSVVASGSNGVPADLPQVVKATIAGTATSGWTYRLTVGGTNFDHVATGGQTLSDIAAALAVLVDADALYTSSAAGAVVTITGPTGTAFSFAAEVISSTMTIAAAITQAAQ